MLLSSDCTCSVTNTAAALPKFHESLSSSVYSCKWQSRAVYDVFLRPVCIAFAYH